MYYEGDLKIVGSFERNMKTILILVFIILFTVWYIIKSDNK